MKQSTHSILCTLIFLVVVGAGAPTPAIEPGEADPARERLARFGNGVNLSRWFWGREFTSDEATQRLFQDGELQSLQRLGVRHVRLPVSPEFLLSDGPARPVNRERLELVLKAVRRLNDRELGCIVDIHGWDSKALEGDPFGQQAFIEFWEEVAQVLAATDPEWTMLELMNEPIFRDRESEWQVFQGRLITAVRKHAPHHTLVVTGANWSTIDGLLPLKPYSDKNLVYTFHFYDPFFYTHQLSTWSWPPLATLKGVEYPTNKPNAEALLPGVTDKDLRNALTGGCMDDPWDAARIQRRIAEASSWGRIHGVPVHCGEFGVYPPGSPATDRINWLDDTVDAFAREGIAWSIWAWDDAFGLGRVFEDGVMKYDRSAAAAVGFNVPLEMNGSSDPRGKEAP